MRIFHSQCFASNLPFKFQEDETKHLSVIFKGSDRALLLQTLVGWSREIPKQIISQWSVGFSQFDLSIIEDDGKTYYCWGPLSLVRCSRDSPLSVQIDGGAKQGTKQRGVRFVSSPEELRTVEEGRAVMAKKC
jgi:hypothetical protein